MTARLILTGLGHHQCTIRKSRFSASAGPAQHEQQAMAHIEQASDAGASHNCWAWKIGESTRFNDDGEPGGTAGRPILRAIETQGFDRVVVVVQRQFGGIKLGAGGLARAYGGTAAECLRNAPSRLLEQYRNLRCQAPFEHIGIVHQLIERHNARKRQERFFSDGIELDLSVPLGEFEAIRHALLDATGGTARITSLDDPGRRE